MISSASMYQIEQRVEASPLSPANGMNRLESPTQGVHSASAPSKKARIISGLRINQHSPDQTVQQPEDTPLNSAIADETARLRAENRYFRDQLTGSWSIDPGYELPAAAPPPYNRNVYSE